MQLRRIRIQNFRSLQDVDLDALGQMNVLIGRNNVGKSSVIGALEMVANAFRNGKFKPDWSRTLPLGDLQRRFKIRLSFALDDLEREEYINLLTAAASWQEHRSAALRSSPFATTLDCTLASHSRTQQLYVVAIALQAEQGPAALILQMEENPRMPLDMAESSTLTLMTRVLQEKWHTTADASVIGLGSGAQMTNMQLVPQLFANLQMPDPATAWPMRQIGQFFLDAFFLNHLRYSETRPQSMETIALDAAGTNLAQVLHTLKSNDDATFASVARFVQDTIPGIGQLRAPLVGRDTEIRFGRDGSTFATRLPEMGGGIEPMLMMAVILRATDKARAVFMEEPETHLHPGAQRQVAGYLRDSAHQVFVTTHSSVFLNLSPAPTIHQLRLDNGQTMIRRVEDAKDVDAVLDDIGVRLSDVLLSYAALFVEGPGDVTAFESWGDKLGCSLSAHNVNVIPMGGGKGAPARAQALTAVAGRVPIPFLFVLDGDERSQSEIANLQSQLGDRVHVLGRRELENYLLVPRVITAYLHRRNYIQAHDRAAEQRVQALMDGALEGLQARVLLKRIATEMAGLPGGLLHRDDITALLPYAMEEESMLAGRIVDITTARVDGRFQEIDLPGLIKVERERLASDWGNPVRRAELAPGEEVLDSVFTSCGGARYRKNRDMLPLVNEMHKDEIPREIQQLLLRVVGLAKSEANNG